MKKILTIVVFSLVLSFGANPRVAHSHELAIAEESADATIAGEIEDSTTSAESKNVEYVLPFPGMLSDNPLYFIKAIRDRIIEFAISDPVKKADFYLLTSDKRLVEATMLFDKGSSKYSLAEVTVSKGENYFEKGIGQLEQAKKQNLDVNSLIQKYIVSSKKHQESIKGMLDKSQGNVKSGLKHSQKRSSEFEKMLINL